MPTTKASERQTSSSTQQRIAHGTRLRAHGKKAQRCFDNLRNADHPNALHDARVSLRRIITILRAFAVPKSKKLLKNGKRLLQHSSKARDLEVLLAWLSAPHPEFAAGSSSETLTFFRREQQRALRKARFYSKKHLAKFIAHLEKLCRQLQPRQQRLTPHAVRSLLRRKTSQLRRLQSDNHRHHSDKQLHEQRILCKECRYIAELLPHKESGRRIKQLLALQDHLGRLHDLTAMRALIGKRARAIAQTHTGVLIERAIRDDALHVPISLPGESNELTSCLEILHALTVEHARMVEEAEWKLGSGV